MKTLVKWLPAAAFLAAGATASADNADILSGKLTVKPQSFTTEEFNACFDALVPEKTADGLTDGATKNAQVGPVSCGAHIYDVANLVSLYAYAEKKREDGGRDLYGAIRYVCPEGRGSEPLSVEFAIGLEKGLFINLNETVEANDLLGISDIKKGEIAKREISVEHWQSGSRVYLHETFSGKDPLADGALINAADLANIWSAVNGNIRNLVDTKNNATLKSYVEDYFNDHPSRIPPSCEIR